MSTKSIYIFGPEDRSVEGKAIGAIINDRLCLPILKELYLINDGNYKTNLEILNNLSSKINLEGPDIQAHGNNGNEFEYRAKWALNHLKNIGFVNKDQDNNLSWKITREGVDFLKSNEIIENDNFETEKFNLIFKELKNLINVKYEGKKYWALGFGSGEYYTRLEKFKNENYWQALDYDESDNSNVAKRARQKFNQIKISDFVIIKGYGGNHDIVVHYKGKVKEIIPSEYKLIFEKIDGKLYNGKAPKGQGAGNWRDTIVEVKRKKDINLLFFDNSLEIENNPNIEKEIESKDRNKVFNIPLNQILYGPPGTGKTYKLQQIIYKWGLKEINKIDKDYSLFVVDYTWWQIIALVLFENDKITVPEIAKHPLVKAKLGSSNVKHLNTRLWSSLQHHCVDHCENVNLVKRTGERIFYKEVNSEWRLDDIEDFKKEYFSLIETYEDFKNSDDSKSKDYTFTTCHQSLSYEDFIEGIKPKLHKESDLDEEENESKNVVYEIRKGIFYKACEKAVQKAGFINLKDCLDRTKEERKEVFDKAVKENNIHVIFLDEINRSNVSNVFGELITLIEEDKRLGKENEISDIILPYSQDNFGVPPNLYIIGTMNTADRSVEALDTALRRRFSFEEIPPKYDLEELEIEVYGFALKDILGTINKRIIRLLNNDHAIGHSYFLNKDEVSIIESFNRNIIPLLQEYFFGDYGKMMLVLGDGFVKYDEWKDEEKFFASYSDAKNEYDVKDLYSIKNYKTEEKEGFAEALKKLMNR